MGNPRRRWWRAPGRSPGWRAPGAERDIPLRLLALPADEHTLAAVLVVWLEHEIVLVRSGPGQQIDWFAIRRQRLAFFHDACPGDVLADCFLLGVGEKEERRSAFVRRRRSWLLRTSLQVKGFAMQMAPARSVVV